MKRSAIQTTLFPDIPRTAFKPERIPLEKDFMQDIQRYASSLNLPSVHIENYCGNSFNVACPVCGNSTLATCRKTLNKALVGYPDILGLSWAIETKRDGYEPTTLQVATHERLRRQGVPVMVCNPGNLPDAVRFLQKLARKDGDL
jgi:hypothetical protein